MKPVDDLENAHLALTEVSQPERKIRVSPKKKYVLVLCYIFGFYVGLHAFYAGKIKKGFFYLFSISGIFIYYAYILYYLSHNWLTSWLHLSISTWFSIYTAFNIVIQHIPFLGWTAYFGSYLIFLFLFALILIIGDAFAIMFGKYKDGNGLKIVSRQYKRKHMHKILEY